MLRKMSMMLIVGSILALAGVYGSAALTSLSIDRSATVSVEADNAATAGVKITCLDNSGGGGTNWTSLCSYSAAGVVTLDLDMALKSDSSLSYNRFGSYALGGAADAVLRVANNLGADAITVQLNASPEAAVSMVTAAGADATSAPVSIAPGLYTDFRFNISTPASGPIGTYTIQIRK